MRAFLWASAAAAVLVLTFDVQFIYCDGKKYNKLKEYNDEGSGRNTIRQSIKANKEDRRRIINDDDDENDGRPKCIGKKCSQKLTNDDKPLLMKKFKEKHLPPSEEKPKFRKEIRNVFSGDEDNIRNTKVSPKANLKINKFQNNDKKTFNRRREEKNDTDEDDDDDDDEGSATDEDDDDDDGNTDEDNVTDDDDDDDDDTDETEEDEEKEVCVRNKKGKCSNEDDTSGETEEQEDYIPKKKKAIYIKKFAHEKESKLKRFDVDTAVLKIHKVAAKAKGFRRFRDNDDSDDDSEEESHPKRFQLNLEDED